jgi:glycosyltransferase involved in cell wall biosynthesis
VPDLPTLPPIAGQPLSVVLLAFNAEAHLHSVVTSWTAYLNGLGREWELLLVDDGSTDRTAVISADLVGQSPRLRFLKHAAHQGEGAALRTAFPETRFPLLFYALCDPRYRPTHLNRLLVELQKGDPEKPPCPLIDTVHLTVGYHAGVRGPLAWRTAGLLWRFLCRLLFNVSLPVSPGWLGWRRRLGWLLTRILFSIRNHDVTCPVRLLRREILQRMPLQSDGCFVHAEMLAKASFLTLLVSEDIPLGDWKKPVPPPQRHETKGQWLRDLGRVFWRPDFGPVGKPEGGQDAAAP